MRREEGEASGMGVPLQVETSETAVTVLLEVEAEGGAAEAVEDVVEGLRGGGGDAPTGRRRGGLGAAAGAQEEAEAAGRLGPGGGGAEGEAAGGGQVEGGGRAGDLGDDGGGATAIERLLEGPQGLLGAVGGDLDETAGVEAEEMQAGRMEGAGLTPRLGGADPDDAAVAPLGEAGEEGAGETGDDGGVASGVADDLVQRAEGKAAGRAEPCVEPGQAEGQRGVVAAPPVDPAERRTALEPGDGASQIGETVGGIERRHGSSSSCSYFVLKRSRAGVNGEAHRNGRRRPSLLLDRGRAASRREAVGVPGGFPRWWSGRRAPRLKKRTGRIRSIRRNGGTS